MSDKIWADTIIQLLPNDQASLGALRIHRSIKVLPTQDFIWVKGRYSDIEIQKELKKLPALNRFYADKKELTPIGSALAIAPIPQGDWQSIMNFITPQCPEILEAPEVSLVKFTSNHKNPIKKRLLMV